MPALALSVVALASLACSNQFAVANHDGIALAPSPYSSLPATYNSTLRPFKYCDDFVSAKDGQLYYGGELWKFASLNNPDLIGSAPYEIDDTFRTLVGFGRPVTRTYTLGIQSINVGADKAFILSWNNQTNDFNYNENMFQKLDDLMNRARSWGAKLVLPVINQDYGTEDSNYNGNWADLIRMRYNLDSYNATKPYNFWTDPIMIDCYDKILTKLLTRTNTINGKIYGQDNTFWALETGNEMNYNMTPGADATRPPPGSWTVHAAETIKSLAPNLLVMDGSLSRNNFTEQKWAPEALAASAVDIFSSHYYRNSPVAYDYHNIVPDSQWIRQHGKTFVAGEHGFYNETTQWDEFNQLLASTETAGAMAWGMRPHSVEGGFVTHGEGDGIFSYHAPGWSPAVTADFDPLELYVIRSTYQTSFKVVDEPIPNFYPIPNAPILLAANSTGNGTTVLPFQGASWAEHYEVFQAGDPSQNWTQVANFVRDDVDAGNANWTVPAGSKGSFVMRGVSVDLQHGPWSNVVTV